MTQNRTLIDEKQRLRLMSDVGLKEFMMTHYADLKNFTIMSSLCPLYVQLSLQCTVDIERFT